MQELVSAGALRAPKHDEHTTHAAHSTAIHCSTLGRWQGCNML
jgi:hypothetical protein